MASFTKFLTRLAVSKPQFAARRLAPAAAARFFASNSVKFTFITKEGKEAQVEAQLGENLLEIGKANNLEIEGACEGTLACSTCHVQLEPKQFEVAGTVTDDERDMLDLAKSVGPTSRLGCQVKVTPEFEGCKVKIM